MLWLEPRIQPSSSVSRSMMGDLVGDMLCMSVYGRRYWCCEWMWWFMVCKGMTPVVAQLRCDERKTRKSEV